MHKIPIGMLDCSNIVTYIKHIRVASRKGFDSKVQYFCDKLMEEVDRAEFEYQSNLNVKNGGGI